MFAVTVSFIIAPDSLEAFADLVKTNAAASVQNETGCRQFDVCTDPSNSSVFFLYEIYDDAAAFDVHCASAHFRTFSDACAKMVIAKDIATYQNVTAAHT